MRNIDKFSRQHEEIKEELDFIEININKNNYEENLSEIALHINKLSGKLIIHLGSEDKFLYPDLLKTENLELRNMAKEYMDEMGNISEKFKVYKDKNNTKTKIFNNNDKFIIETKEIISQIRTRMRKEEEGLYTLI